MSGRRRRAHAEHQHHEAWAIPYGDLLTLLLAFFVVMYSISSVNEGKYRVVADAMSDAFGGPPKSSKPVQLGEHAARDDRGDAMMFVQRSVVAPLGAEQGKDRPPQSRNPALDLRRDESNLDLMENQLTRALGSRILGGEVSVRRTEEGLEVALNTDILFSSGSAALQAQAQKPLRDIADIMRGYPNRLRIEGHTDNNPIHTSVFPSNWELSAARAASVVHLFMDAGVAPGRMSVVGLAEFQPLADNQTADGRDRNRRVNVVVLAGPGDQLPPDTGAAAETAQPTAAALQPPELLQARDPVAATAPNAAATP